MSSEQIARLASEAGEWLRNRLLREGKPAAIAAYSYDRIRLPEPPLSTEGMGIGPFPLHSLGRMFHMREGHQLARVPEMVDEWVLGGSTGQMDRATRVLEAALGREQVALPAYLGASGTLALAVYATRWIGEDVRVTSRSIRCVSSREVSVTPSGVAGPNHYRRYPSTINPRSIITLSLARSGLSTQRLGAVYRHLCLAFPNDRTAITALAGAVMHSGCSDVFTSEFDSRVLPSSSSQWDECGAWKRADELVTTSLAMPWDDLYALLVPSMSKGAFVETFGHRSRWQGRPYNAGMREKHRQAIAALSADPTVSPRNRESVEAAHWAAQELTSLQNLIR